MASSTSLRGDSETAEELGVRMFNIKKELDQRILSSADDDISEMDLNSKYIFFYWKWITMHNY